jgi:redox-sensitive bicupin YhaK (pirin superfamily)
METVTFILEGDILHEDSGGHTSVIEAGGIQYMRAGKGLLHAETSSDNFKREGGPLEILQLWVNMPARLKMAEPLYIGKQSSEIPEVEIDRAKVHLVFGELNGTNGAIKHDALDIVLSWVDLPSGTSYKPDVPAEHTIFCYIVRGKLKINGLKVAERQLVEFDYGKGDIEIAAEQESIILFGHAKPLNEPVVAQGPFVMNTEDEIRQAYQDYQAGKFGSW